MSISAAAILSLLLALAKAVPAVEAILGQVMAELHEQRRAATHARIDQAIAEARALPWVCPAACPHRLQHAAEPGGSTPGAS